jgi:hypothetical protein
MFAIVAGVLAAALGGVVLYDRRTAPRRRLGDDGFEPTGDPDDVECDPDDPDCVPPPTPDEPGRGCGCLRIGKAHPRYAKTPTRICLTPKQEQVLFKNTRPQQEKLGCGVFACAYTTPGSSRVVKFTRDAEDVAALIKAQGTGLVPKVFAAYKLAQPGIVTTVRGWPYHEQTQREHVPVYAVVLERLRTIPHEQKEDLNERILGIRDVVEGKITGAEFCDTQQGEDGNVGCDDQQLAVLTAAEKLKKAGIEWSDIHAGNIGYDKRGKLKVLDLGLTKTELKRRLRTLRDAKPFALVPALEE